MTKRAVNTVIERVANWGGDDYRLPFAAIVGSFREGQAERGGAGEFEASCYPPFEFESFGFRRTFLGKFE
jgi:hypothetical protein